MPPHTPLSPHALLALCALLAPLYAATPLTARAAAQTTPATSATSATSAASATSATSAAGAAGAPAMAPAQAAPLRFELRLDSAAAAGMAGLGLEVPVNGRAYVIVTRDSAREPRRQVGVAGVPLWGVDVHDWRPGTSVVLADAPRGPDGGGGGAAGGSPGAYDTGVVAGYPLDRIAELPAGDYYVQGFVNVYTTFRRADGHTVRLHQDAGDGQNPWISPGNAHSAVRRVRLDPAAGGTVVLELTDVIAPIEPVPPGGTLQQGNPQDREHVRFVKIRSALLSEFWGRDMYIGANVLLPRDHAANPGRRYPALYHHGHFPGRSAPFGFGSGARQGRAAGFDEFWLSDDAPEMVVITIRDANPFYDTSYSVNSANVGPYGDAIVHELIPHLEREFRLIPGRHARVLAGGSTGGWEALAMHVFYPDEFGGSWSWCPDAVDFRAYQIVNIYEDANAYTLDRGWLEVERPGMRRPDGNVLYTMRDENRFELAVGNRSRSAGQWAIWEAVYGPVGPDGYPQPIWDPHTGAIDREVAEYWRSHYDLTAHLRRSWPVLGPKLRGEIHVAVGDMDNYYLELATYLLQEFLDSADPPADATFEYGRRQPHCWIGHSRERPGEQLSNSEFVRIVGEYLQRTRR
jgi:hypothetical protein